MPRANTARSPSAGAFSAALKADLRYCNRPLSGVTCYAVKLRTGDADEAKAQPSEDGERAHARPARPIAGARTAPYPALGSRLAQSARARRSTPTRPIASAASGKRLNRRLDRSCLRLR